MKPLRNKAFRRWAPGGALWLLLLALPGCLGPERAVAEVDEEAYEAIGAKQEVLRGERSPFSIDPLPDRVAATQVDPENGLVRERGDCHLTLAQILNLAAANSREFQDAKESLYRAALSLMRERENFRDEPFGALGISTTSGPGGDSLRADSEFGLTNLIERGGSYALSVGLDFVRFLSSPTSESLLSFVNLTVSLPFLRNAELNFARENLTQADREVMYALRDFERFKQTYGVQVISSYLRVLSQHQRISNEEANLENLSFVRRRNERMFAEGRMSVVEVDQARQQELQGEDRLVVARQGLERSLDSLKDLLGLPVDLRIGVEMEDLAGLPLPQEGELELDERHLMTLALRGRLDFRNAVDGVTDAERRMELAESDLRPDLNLLISASPVSKDLKPLRYNFQDGTYSASADFDLGLDRDLESISLRSALIDRQRALRSQEAMAEQVKVEVRAALRQARQAKESWAIARSAVELAEKRVRSSRALLAEGRVQTRDYLESQSALLRTQNEMVDALIEYRIAYLELFRDTGALVVSPGGLDHETTRALLEVD